MPKIDLSAHEATNATGYPLQFAREVAGRWYKRLGPLNGLTDFGVSHVTLEPGAWSSQRHWHEEEDELVVMLEGEAMLVDDSGETPLRAGDLAAFPKNDGNGHVLKNVGDRPCTFVAIGKLGISPCHYPDIDMHKPVGALQFSKSGERYEPAGTSHSN